MNNTTLFFFNRNKLILALLLALLLAVLLTILIPLQVTAESEMIVPEANQHLIYLPVVAQ